MKAGFEDAYSLLSDFAFADAESRENVLWALLWAVNVRSPCCVSQRTPLIVIEGPQCSGKSHLARLITGAKAFFSPKTMADMRSVIRGCVEKNAPVLVLEELGRGALKCPDLSAFLSCREWELGMRGRKATLRTTLRTLTVMVCRCEELSPDLERRAIFIRLKTRPVRGMKDGFRIIADHAGEPVGEQLMRLAPAKRRCPVCLGVLSYSNACRSRKVPFCAACNQAFPRGSASPEMVVVVNPDTGVVCGWF